MSTTTNRSHSEAQVMELSQQIVLDALKTHDHALVLVLDALLSAYAAVAYTHPCCTVACGKMAVSCGQQLIVLATEKPANVTTH